MTRQRGGGGGMMVNKLSQTVSHAVLQCKQYLRWGNDVMQDSCLVHCDEWPYVLWRDHGRIIYGTDEMHMAKRSAMWCQFPPPGSTTGTLLSYILRSNTMWERGRERERERERESTRVREREKRENTTASNALTPCFKRRPQCSVKYSMNVVLLTSLLLKQCWIPRSMLNTLNSGYQEHSVEHCFGRKVFILLILLPSPTISHEYFCLICL